MKLDDHLDILLECVVNCFRPDPENSRHQHEVSRATLHELEYFVQVHLPVAYQSIVRSHGCLSDYFYNMVIRDSVESNNVLGQFKQMTSMELSTDLFEYEGYESVILLEVPGTRKYKPDLDDPLERELFKLYKDKALQSICRRRLDLRERLEKMIHRIWPHEGYQVVIFGSSANGLGTNNGDVDLCITEARDRPRHNNNSKFQYYNELLYDMHFLRRELIGIGMENVIAIQNSSVPICKFFDPVTGLRGDINANSKLGIENTRLIKTYTALDKRVGPFLFAIKYFANSKGINDSPGGTISSYAYYLLGLHYLMAVITNPIIKSLQQMNCSWSWCSFHQHNKRIEGNQVRFHDCLELIENGKYHSAFHERSTTHTIQLTNNFDSLGTLIRGFFDYCAKGGILEPSSIICNDGNPLYPKNPRKGGWMDSSLIIQDPFIRSKNVARPCTELGLQRILEEFEKASSLLDRGYTFGQVCQLA